MRFIIILSLRWLHYGSSPTPSTSRQCVLANVTLACPAKQTASKERIVKFDTDANQSELTIDAAPVFCLMSRISSDPLRIRTKQSRDSLGRKQTTPRLAHYVGNSWMTKGECIPSKSPTHTTSLNVSSDSCAHNIGHKPDLQPIGQQHAVSPRR